MKKMLWLFMITCLVGCGAYGKDYKFLDLTRLTDNGIELNATRFKSGTYQTNYFLWVTVKNISDQEIMFDSADIELVDDTTGISLYSISKDKTEVSVPIQEAAIITKTSIKPGRTISGKIMFPTSVKEAKAKSITLYYGKQTIKLKQ